MEGEREFLLESGAVIGGNGMQATVFAKFGHKKCLAFFKTASGNDGTLSSWTTFTVPKAPFLPAVFLFKGSH